jgi:hypothetical protein
VSRGVIAPRVLNIGSPLDLPSSLINVGRLDSTGRVTGLNRSSHDPVQAHQEWQMWRSMLRHRVKFSASFGSRKSTITRVNASIQDAEGEYIAPARDQSMECSKFLGPRAAVSNEIFTLLMVYGMRSAVR